MRMSIIVEGGLVSFETENETKTTEPDVENRSYYLNTNPFDSYMLLCITSVVTYS